LVDGVAPALACGSHSRVPRASCEPRVRQRLAARRLPAGLLVTCGQPVTFDASGDRLALFTLRDFA